MTSGALEASPQAGEALETVTDAASFQVATEATPAQMVDLERFRELLADANTRMNLVGPSALAEFWPRHAWDSAQLLKLAPGALTWADLGAGAGFPGLVLAILLKSRQGARVHLVESVGKRCRFLERVVIELDLPAEVHNARAGDLSVTVDCVTARACAPMSRLLDYAAPFLRRGATGLFLKGRGVQTELGDAAKVWTYNFELRPSLSDSAGRIVVVKGAPRRHGRR